VRTIVLASILGVVGGLETGAAAPQPAIFRSAIDLVSISAVVRDQRGQLVTTLASADFEVRDNGESRRIVDFQAGQTSAITLAVLLDTSGSMSVGPKLALAQQVLSDLSGELQEGRDEVGLFTFDAALHEQRPFSVHRGSLAGAFNEAEPFGTTSLYDAIAETARRLAGRPSARRAIVVLTDGTDTASTLTPAEVSALASSVDVPVYVVVTVPAIDRAHYLQTRLLQSEGASADLGDLAGWTGGALLWVTATEEGVIRARQVIAELRQQYLISIESSAEPAWRSIDVRTRNRRLTVRARKGYFSGEGRPGH
jgi:VWFA-related protein